MVSTTSWAVFWNLVDSAEEIQENSNRPGSIPIYSRRFLKTANRRLA
jgi:hypothetical protein